MFVSGEDRKFGQLIVRNSLYAVSSYFSEHLTLEILPDRQLDLSY